MFHNNGDISSSATTLQENKAFYTHKKECLVHRQIHIYIGDDIFIIMLITSQLGGASLFY